MQIRVTGSGIKLPTVPRWICGSIGTRCLDILDPACGHGKVDEYDKNKGKGSFPMLSILCQHQNLSKPEASVTQLLGR